VNAAGTSAFQPTHAEQVRSILAAASSMSVAVNGTSDDLLGPDLVSFDFAPACGVPAFLEWTDVAPVAVRERTRGRVGITGRLHAPEPGPGNTVSMLLEARQVALVTKGFSTLVDPASLEAAEPDPLARYEAALLLHLAEDHQDQVAALTRLLDARELLGVVRVTRLALDRYGIVLRLDYHRAQQPHQDVRLAFAEPLADSEQVGHRLHTLIAHSQRRGRRSART
jgi:Protein of unknown function (DUF2470)